MKQYEIAVIPGDGIGNGVVPEGLAVLERLGSLFDIRFTFRTFPWSCGLYKKTGKMSPDDGLSRLRDHDAIFFEQWAGLMCRTIFPSGGCSSQFAANLTNTLISGQCVCCPASFRQCTAKPLSDRLLGRARKLRRRIFANRRMSIRRNRPGACHPACRVYPPRH